MQSKSHFKSPYLLFLPFIPSSRAAWIGVLPTSLLSLDTTVSAGWDTIAQKTPAGKNKKINTQINKTMNKLTGFASICCRTGHFFFHSIWSQTKTNRHSLAGLRFTALRVSDIFTLRCDWLTGLSMSFVIGWSDGLDFGFKVGTHEGASPWNKSRGQVPSCELVIFASKSSRRDQGFASICCRTGFKNSGHFFSIQFGVKPKPIVTRSQACVFPRFESATYLL